MSPDAIRGLAALTTGIYVLTVRDGERRHGMSSSWVTQVSGEPPLLVAAVDRRHVTHDIIARTRRFALNVLGARGRELEDYFYSDAARHPDNLDGVACRDSTDGLPLLDGALASLECRVEQAVPAGDHTLFVASVVRVTWREEDRPPRSGFGRYVIPGPERPLISPLKQLQRSLISAISLRSRLHAIHIQPIGWHVDRYVFEPKPTNVRPLAGENIAQRVERSARMP
jgi:flavin reductase (DIM6/NTAB) family NADH-FMN oxidoreductase RutF